MKQVCLNIDIKLAHRNQEKMKSKRVNMVSRYFTDNMKMPSSSTGFSFFPYPKGQFPSPLLTGQLLYLLLSRGRPGRGSENACKATKAIYVNKI